MEDAPPSAHFMFKTNLLFLLLIVPGGHQRQQIQTGYKQHQNQGVPSRGTVISRDVRYFLTTSIALAVIGFTFLVVLMVYQNFPKM